MASSFKRVPDSLPSSHKCSTAQACLRKILHTIATCPISSENNLGDGNASSDLAPRLGSPGSFDAELFTGESGLTIEKCSENIQERTEEGSDISNGDGAQRLEGSLEQSKASGSGDSEDRPERSKFDGFLGLLVEAARWVSGGFGDGDGSESEGQSRRGRTRAGREEQEEGASQGQSGGGGRNNLYGESGYVPEEAAAAARRSERGRNRVMPCRYRDSVLEPYWKRMSPPRRSRRMSGPVSSKRRPR